MRQSWDLVIIGAGPAGMSAALEALTHGVSVLVLDRQEQPGGQIFRSVGQAGPEKRNKLGADYARGFALTTAFLNSEAEFLGGASVWHLSPGRVYFSRAGESMAVTARYILIATGAMERPVPVPGWTLPGVMGAGAADVLLKSASLIPKGPVILCGNGPLILQTAVHLNEFHVPVAGVVLTGDPFNVFRALPRLPGALSRPLYMGHGLTMGLRMLTGASCRFGAENLSIRKEHEAFSVTFRSRGRMRTLQGGSVLLHEGVVPETRITRLARLRHAWNRIQRYWHADTDQWGSTSLEGILCAGDAAGVRGADPAMAGGRLAALEVCRRLDRLVLDERDAAARPYLGVFRRGGLMQGFMDRVFAPRPSNLQPADEAVVCRCEELTAGELRKTILSGCFSPDGLKAQARPGMGTCQGRMCSAAVAEMIANANAVPLERLAPYHAQLPLVPLSLGELAAMTIPDEGL